MDFEKTLEKIGPFGRYQLYHFILMGLGGMPAGMNTMANVFLAGIPEYSCATTSLPVSESNGFLSAIKPSTGDLQCTVYDVNHTDVLLTSGWGTGNATNVIWLNGTDTQACSGWKYDREQYGQTIVSTWDLVCDNAWRKSMASSIYMLGFLVGAIGFGSIADRFGRKAAWVLASAVMAVSGIAAAFVPSYWAHVFLRLCSGSGSGGSCTTGFVLTMEMVGPSHRMALGIFFQGWFTLGYMILPVLAYAIKDYRYLVLTISLIQGFFCINVWLVRESPRWLLAQGRTEEYQAEIERAARMNGKDNPQQLVEAEAKHLVEQQEEVLESTKHTVIDLLRTPNMRKKSLNIFYNWFVNSFVYYGLSLGVSDLVGSPYLNMFLSGLVEFPSFIIATLLLDRVGRRWPLAVLMAGGGFCCLGTIFVPADMGGVTVALTLLGKFAISGSFSIIYVYSAEIFPTVVRTTGVGAGSMHARIGGLIAPFVADLGLLVWKPLPFIIFGSCAVLGGGLALLLPETLHQTLPETMEDGEHFGRGQWDCCGSSAVPLRDNEHGECMKSVDMKHSG